MRIAVLGATSQIARDFILSAAAEGRHELALYARRPDSVHQWMGECGLGTRFDAFGFEAFSPAVPFDAIINFVGSGNPVQTLKMGASILDVTHAYDTLALDYLRAHPQCRYIFMSSGAAYCSSFEQPVDEQACASVPLNNLAAQDLYSVAKLYAECRHRALPSLPIVDIRIFNYFSHRQDMSARFLITDIFRTIQADAVLQTSPVDIVRDFLGPDDFYQLIDRILQHEPCNQVVDCYTREPVGKIALLKALQAQFGLKYEVVGDNVGVNATGAKLNYFSRNARAASFGFKPSKSSLQNVLDEFSLALDSK